MGHNINGLHHCATDKQQEKRVMGNNRSPHKDGTFRRLPRHREPRRPSRPLPLASYKTSRTAKQYCIRQRILVYLRLLETSNGSTRDITQPQHSLPPTNGRTNGKSQCHSQAVSPGILQLPAGRLGEVAANCRILLQQHTNQNHKNNPPFFGNFGYHPRFLPDLSTRNDETPEVSEYVEALRRLHEELRAEIKEAQMSQAEQANKARHSDPVLNPGDKVWLR